MGVPSTLLDRVPLGHAATGLSMLLAAVTFASYLDGVLDAQPDAFSLSRRISLGSELPHRHASWAGSCASNSDMPQLRWQQLTRDPSSMVAALYVETDVVSSEDLRYVLLLVHSMQTMGYAVTYYHSRAARVREAWQLLRLAASFNLALQANKLRARPWVPGSPLVRFFIYSGPGPHPQVPGIGLVNAFHNTASSSSSSSGGALLNRTRLMQLLAYDHVLFSTEALYAEGMRQLQDSLQCADTEALLMPSLDLLLPAFSFAASVPAAPAQMQQRRHILNIAKDQYESLQALGVFSRMRAAGQLPSNTQLLLVLRQGGNGRDNARLLTQIGKRGLTSTVQVLMHSSLAHAVDDPVVLDYTLVHWHLTGRRAHSHAGCAPTVVESMMHGFIPVSTCGGSAVQVIGHGVSGYLAESLDDVATHTAHLFGLPMEERQRLWSAAAVRARSFTFDAFQVMMEKVEGRGIASRPFRHLVSRTLPVLRSCVVANVSRSARNAAVIVEARAHYALEYVILNTMAVLERSSQPWSLHIYSGEESAWLVQRLTSDPRLANAQVHQLQETNPSVAAYNSLLKTPGFWQELGQHADRVLIFQTDSLLLGPSIEPYLGLDYVGAPWHTNNERWPLIEALVPPGVGNGGLSLRSVKAMLDIVRHNASEPREQEDLYFARNIYSRNASRLASRTLAYRFGQEVPCYDLDPLVHEPPFSIHAAWYYMPLRRTQHLLERAFAASLNKVLA